MVRLLLSTSSHTVWFIGFVITQEPFQHDDTTLSGYAYCFAEQGMEVHIVRPHASCNADICGR